MAALIQYGATIRSLRDVTLFERAQIVCALIDPSETCVFTYVDTQMRLGYETLMPVSEAFEEDGRHD